MTVETRLYVTRPDAIALSALVESLARLTAERGAEAELLREVLDHAQIVAADTIPAEVVTLNSTVVFEDVASGKASQVTLVLPVDADPAANRISVVSPMGRALLGRHVADVCAVELPNGDVRHVRVRSIPYQPEAEARRAAD